MSEVIVSPVLPQIIPMTYEAVAPEWVVAERERARIALAGHAITGLIIAGGQWAIPANQIAQRAAEIADKTLEELARTRR